MTALLDATDSQMATLAGLVEALHVAEATVSSMHAARDGLLAMAGRLAIEIAKQGDHPDRGDHSIRTVAAEIAAVQRASDRTIERRVAAATVLVDLFPTVWAAQGTGRISAAHSRVITDAGSHLSDTARADYAAIMIPLAEHESPNRLRPLARRIAERFAPTTITSRHRKARTHRRVWVTESDDGMAALHTHAPAALAHGMFDRLSQMAHLIRTENLRATRDARRAGHDHTPDTRTVDEIRADLLADLVLTGAPTGHDSTDALLTELRAHITITVPITTLIHTDHTDHTDTGDHTGATDTDDHSDAAYTDDTDANANANANANDADADADSDADSDADADADADADVDETSSAPHTGAGASNLHSPPSPQPAPQPLPQPAPPPAELDGVVPIDTDTARHLAGNATGWDRVFTHPVTGGALSVDRYRPSKHLRRHLRARDTRCRFPGCGIPARKSDLDHTQAASTGGGTTHTNLATLCRRHHVLKHHTPWHVEQRQNGVLVWTSPTGRTYTDTPPAQNTVTFAATATGAGEAAEAAAPF